MYQNDERNYYYNDNFLNTVEAINEDKFCRKFKKISLF